MDALRKSINTEDLQVHAFLNIYKWMTQTVLNEVHRAIDPAASSRKQSSRRPASGSGGAGVCGGAEQVLAGFGRGVRPGG